MCQIHTLMVLGLSSVAFSSVDRVGYPQLRFKRIVTRYLLFKDNMISSVKFELLEPRYSDTTL